MIVSDKTMENLKALGERLRAERLQRNDTQRMFAARIGASVPTLLRMESGDPNVTLGYWMRALEMLGRESDINQLLPPPEDLFEKYERVKKPKRQRACKKKSTEPSV